MEYNTSKQRLLMSIISAALIIEVCVFRVIFKAKSKGGKALKFLVTRWGSIKVYLWLSFGMPLAHLWSSFGTPKVYLWHAFGSQDLCFHRRYLN